MTRRCSCHDATQARRGFTLIEMLVAISLTGIISLTAAQLLILFMQLQNSTALNAAGDLSRERLERQFRNDVHSATKAEVITRAGQQLLRLSAQDGSEIEFSPDPSGARRRASVSGEVRSEDLWTLPEGGLRFEVRGSLVEMISTDAKGTGRAGSAPPAAWHFIAGKGLKLARGTGGGSR